jgi:hypothetical protein
MREVSDAFLLQMAEVSGGLIGLFMVGVFFFVETGFQTGFRRLGAAREIFEPYFRASTRIVLLLSGRSPSRSPWSSSNPSGPRCCSRS